MTPAERAAARERCEKATAGDWFFNPDTAEHEWESHDIYGQDGRRVLGLHSYKLPDALFIAHARTDLPAALDEVDAKDAEIERLRELLREFEWTVRTHDMCFRKGSKAQLLAARALAALEGEGQ